MDQNVVPPLEDHSEIHPLFNLGAWLGRHQAFALISSKCSAADAQCLREIRENKLYKALGLSWEEFCARHTGIDCKTAERIIDRLEEFGEAYFNLAKIMPLQPSAYRTLAPVVSENAIEFDGERIPITPENAGRLIEAVRKLRSRVERAPTNHRPPFAALQSRLDRCLADLTAAIRRGLSEEQRAELIAMFDHATSRFDELLKGL